MQIIDSNFQTDIYNFIEHGTGNAVVNAVAGSGKTTTLINCMKRIPPHLASYFLAFGKDIAKELAKRAPSHTQVSTIHSVGWQALLKAYRCKPNFKKVYAHLDLLKQSWFHEDNLPEDEQFEYGKRVARLADLYRLCLCATIDQLEEIAIKYEVETINGECKRAIELVNHMNRDTKEFDFVDMIYQPAIDKRIVLPLVDWLLIDECQDMNAAMRAVFLKMMKPTSRFIAVGDPYQAIFGFAGADADSFEQLKRLPNTVELPLSVCYRCAKNIVVKAKDIVPHIVAFDMAVDGEVNEGISYLEIKDGDMVLCRNNAPLVKMCFEFIKDHKKAYVRGKDIGYSMISLIRRAKTEVISKLEDYLEEQLEQMINRLAKQYKNLERAHIEDFPSVRMFQDKISVIQEIIDSGNIKWVRDIITKLENLFDDDGEGVCFSTVHKAKGLEKSRVFIIERELFGPRKGKQQWQAVQELNIEYVAYTRAKHLLGFVCDWQYKPKKNKSKTEAA